MSAPWERSFLSGSIVTQQTRVVKENLRGRALDNSYQEGHNQKKSSKYLIWEKSHVKRADQDKHIRDLYNAVMLCCAALVLLAGLGRTLQILGL